MGRSGRELDKDLTLQIPARWENVNEKDVKNVKNIGAMFEQKHKETQMKTDKYLNSNQKLNKKVRRQINRRNVAILETRCKKRQNP